MATEVITVGRMPPIDFAPATEAEEVIQNVRCILATTKYSVPLDRDLGLDATYLDMPMEVAKAQMVSDIVLAIARDEPRAAVSNVDWEHDIDGILRAKVQVKTNEDTD